MRRFIFSGGIIGAAVAAAALSAGGAHAQGLLVDSAKAAEASPPTGVGSPTATGVAQGGTPITRPLDLATPMISDAAPNKVDVAVGAQGRVTPQSPAPRRALPEPQDLVRENSVRVATTRNIVEATALAGGSIVVESSLPFAEVSVANPEIADVAALSPQAIYVLGKKVGRTNLTVINARGDVDAVINLQVEPDLGELKKRLIELLPAEPVEVRSAAAASC